MLMTLSFLSRDVNRLHFPSYGLRMELVPWSLVLLLPVPGSSRRFHSHLRVKADGGEGTLPVAGRRANQKCEGVTTTNQTTCMSCTDKLAK